MKKKDDLIAVSSTESNLVLDDGVDEELYKKFQQAETKKINIGDFINDFINQFISKQTQKAYITDLNFFFKFLKSGGLTIRHPNQIQGAHFQFYRDSLIEKKYSSATINRKLVAVRSFIKWSMACKLIDYNPLDIVKLPKVQTETPTLAFDDVEVVQMLKAPDLSTKKGHMHKLVMHLLFSLGLRRSELTHITIRDIYQERGHYVLKIKGKGDKDRHLPLTPDVINAIGEYTDAMATYGVQFEDQDFLLQSVIKEKNTKPMDGSTVYRIIEKYAKACGINKRVSPHSCRATAISHLLDTQKTPIRDVAIFAGHAKITTTERYDKRRESLDNSAAYSVNYNDETA
jgi:site-specific recombinase XerD